MHDRMRPDYLSTVTGWVWLDRATAPIWAAWCWWGKRRLYRIVGDGDTRRGQTIVREAVRRSVEGPK